MGCLQIFTEYLLVVGPWKYSRVCTCRLRGYCFIMGYYLLQSIERDYLTARHDKKNSVKVTRRRTIEIEQYS